MSENVNNTHPENQPENPETPETENQDTAPETAEETFTVTRDQMEKMEQLAKMVSDASDKYLRLAAEYDNFRKRTAKEKESLYGDAKADTVKPFLEVLDNLERGLAQFEEGTPPPGHGDDLQAVHDRAGKLGVQQIEALGQPFDPARHNAVMHVEDESAGENTVVEVFQQGYALGDKVLRFAMVKVAN